MTDPTPALAGGWTLATSHDEPTLVDPSGQAHGPRDYLTIQQVAQLRGTSRRAVQLLVTRGALPARRLGHAWLITVADAIAYRDGRRSPQK